MIQKTIFDGFEALEVVTKKIHLVLVTECGPRVAFFGKPKGENILYWDKDGPNRGDWKIYGGHRVWLTRPFADESEDTYLADNDPCDIEVGEDYVIATAPPHPMNRLSRGMKVEVLTEDTIKVTSFIRNDSNMIYSGGVWTPTCINPEGKTIHVKLGEDNTTWDIVKIVIPRVYGGDEVKINDPQVTFTEDEMIVKPSGTLTKRCVSSPKGEIYTCWPKENLTFTKKVKYIRDARYPLDGCNMAVYVGKDNWMAEMETYGVEQSIRPGETIENEETWILEIK